MMAGRIWVESEVGRGSTFHFTVSFALGVETRAGRARAGGLDDVRVLVVDDSATTRGILVEMLHGWGMIAVSVESGAAALAALDRARQEGAPFGVALLDARMPGMDGVELANRIRENPALSETRVILLIPSGLQVDGSRELRGVGHLMKPVVRSHLLEAIQAVRGGHGSEPRYFRAAIRQSDVRLRVLVAEDSAATRWWPWRTAGERSPPSTGSRSTSSSWTCRCPAWTDSRRLRPSARARRPGGFPSSPSPRTRCRGIGTGASRPAWTRTSRNRSRPRSCSRRSSSSLPARSARTPRSGREKRAPTSLTGTPSSPAWAGTPSCCSRW